MWQSLAKLLGAMQLSWLTYTNGSSRVQCQVRAMVNHRQASILCLEQPIEACQILGRMYP
jgi:hypothetical protein